MNLDFILTASLEMEQLKMVEQAQISQGKSSVTVSLN